MYAGHRHADFQRCAASRKNRVRGSFEVTLGDGIWVFSAFGGRFHGSVYGDQDAVGYELTGHAYFFQGNYKLVRNRPPAGDGQWHLYNIMSDPGEVIDLKETEFARFQRMLSGV